MQNGFMVLHSNRLEALTELLVGWLKQQPLAPLEQETVLVQSNGMAQWLKLKLAEPDALGISAAFSFQMPARFLWSVYRGVLGEDQVPRTSPFDKSRLLWRLYRLLPTLVDEDAFEPLRHFLHDDDDGRKRHQLAERLADLFDAYQVYRADWLSDWQAGRDQLRRAPDSQRASAFPSGQVWQAHLWRALLRDLPEAQRHLSRAAIHEAFLARLERGPRPAALPRRLLVFGISALPQQALEALAALSRHCQVLLLVQNPCKHYWADIVEDRHLLRAQLDGRRRHLLNVPPDNPVHPLLAAWGKQGRDFIGLLYGHDDPDHYQGAFQNQIDLFLDQSAPFTLLQRLQQDILELAPTPAPDERPVAAADRSLTFAIAHGPQREMEVLQDALLQRFSDDPGLRPRDVIVMVPDIETYAPHIDAVFGRLQHNDPRYLPYTLSDRSAGATLPLAGAVETLLHLPQWRFTAADILDLLDVPALRQRFGIGESALPQLSRWIEQANIRWGLHEQQRASLNLPGFEQNSWAFGLRRMLAGYLLGDAQAWRGVEPLDEVAGLGAELAGRLARLLERLDHHWRTFREPARPSQWRQRFATLLDDLFAPESDDDQALDATLRDALNDWLAACQQADFEQPLPLTVARRPVLDALNAESLSQRFMAGRINFCTLMPMRAIPFRHVCLLGMKDGDYPRQQQPMDFDLMRQWGPLGDDGRRISLYRPGDRSRREDDRYLFLEALLSARDSLYISWSGRRARDNSERPPSVLVAQLRDHIDQRWRADDGGDLTPALSVEHPLQPFSSRYFYQTGQSGAAAAPATYAAEWEGLHQGVDLPARASPLAPPDDDEPVTAAALGRFLKQPVAHFFRERLKANLDLEARTLEDTEPFALAGLEQWQLQDRLLEQARRAGDAGFESALADTLDHLAGSGELPLAPFTAASREALAQPLRRPLRDYFQRLTGCPNRRPQHEVILNLPGLRVEDWLTDLRDGDSGPRRLLLVTGRLKERWNKLCPAWVVHLLACADGLALSSELIAQDGRVELPPLPADQALAHLQDLAAAWREGLCRPLPVACATAFAWLGGEQKERAEQDARGVFESGFSHVGEGDKDAALKRAWPDFDTLLAAREAGDSQPALAVWAHRLYAPLFQHCQWHDPGDGQ
ncbi:exodeoxyribonuclease V subunit gamma [Alcanivorax sp. N3-2A]|nr:exodeoxyribonuclease V subunit gamma [Alcanivorax sp. N3-2A]|tara:strand:+ start:8994 stop:12431 length:3438 start_codon:yes stop_codon:yes gene_type:complete